MVFDNTTKIGMHLEMIFFRGLRIFIVDHIRYAYYVRRRIAKRVKRGKKKSDEVSAPTVKYPSSYRSTHFTFLPYT